MITSWSADRARQLTRTRVCAPHEIAAAKAVRSRPEPVGPDSPRLLVIAADHTARGALRAGDRPFALADRGDLLGRLCDALARPGVSGVLGSPDILEDLLLLGALEGKSVFGTMNRGGLAGTCFEIDDRFTAYSAAAIESSRFEGGKMLLRIDPDDPASAGTLESCARAVSELAARGLIAMVEPFIAHRVEGRVRNDLTPDAMVRAIAVASSLGETSAYTWLKVPVVADMERVMATSTLPMLLLGGEVRQNQDSMFEEWSAALAQPTAQGLVVGRALLYPPDDDVARAVDTAVSLL